MYIRSDDGQIYRDFYDWSVTDRIFTVGLILDCLRWFKFDSQGRQISDNPYYTLFLEDSYASI